MTLRLLQHVGVDGTRSVIAGTDDGAAQLAPISPAQSPPAGLATASTSPPNSPPVA
jgi:hypothetical protein